MDHRWFRARAIQTTDSGSVAISAVHSKRRLLSPVYYNFDQFSESCIINSDHGLSNIQIEMNYRRCNFSYTSYFQIPHSVEVSTVETHSLHYKYLTKRKIKQAMAMPALWHTFLNDNSNLFFVREYYLRKYTSILSSANWAQWKLHSSPGPIQH